MPLRYSIWVARLFLTVVPPVFGGFTGNHQENHPFWGPLLHAEPENKQNPCPHGLGRL